MPVSRSECLAMSFPLAQMLGEQVMAPVLGFPPPLWRALQNCWLVQPALLTGFWEVNK